MSIIANTTVISNFACIDQLNFLKQLYGRIYISVEVYEEVRTGFEEGYRFYRDIEQSIYPLANQGWIQLTSMVNENELVLLSQFPSHLHQGEASCIAIAHSRGWLFLTDDKAARKTATSLGIQISGTLGCLVLGVERNFLAPEQANHWLNEMIRLGYRSPVTDLTGLLK